MLFTKFFVFSIAMMVAWLPLPYAEAKPAPGKTRTVKYRLFSSVLMPLRDPCLDRRDLNYVRLPLDNHRHPVLPKWIPFPGGLPYEMYEPIDETKPLIDMVHDYEVTRPYSKDLTARYMEAIYRAAQLHGRTNFLMHQAQSMVEEFEGCLNMNLPQLDNMRLPTYEWGMNILTHMETVYTILANQTAHLFFLHDLKAQTRATCGIANADQHRRTATDFYLVGYNQRVLMCDWMKLFNFLKIDFNGKRIAGGVLDHKFYISAQCDRIKIIDCQVMKASVRLLDDLTIFIKRGASALFRNISMTDGKPIPLQKFLDMKP